MYQYILKLNVIKFSANLIKTNLKKRGLEDLSLKDTRHEIFSYENHKTDRDIYIHTRTASHIKYIQNWDITKKRKCDYPDFRKSSNQGNSGYIHGKNSWTFPLGHCPTL